MPPKSRSGPLKGGSNQKGRSSTPGTGAKPKKRTSSKPTAVQQKTKPKTVQTKKKPPHMRYTEKELKVPQLNGIRPAGIQKPPNAKKGKKFVDDKEQMNAILAIVMAEKEGNIESKMMRARQLEEVREARRLEAEKRVESKKAGLEARKQHIKDSGRKKHGVEIDGGTEAAAEMAVSKKPKKRVSFG